jgi:hypothetical protein
MRAVLCGNVSHDLLSQEILAKIVVYIKITGLYYAIAY